MMGIAFEEGASGVSIPLLIGLSYQGYYAGWLIYMKNELTRTYAPRAKLALLCNLKQAELCLSVVLTIRTSVAAPVFELVENRGYFAIPTCSSFFQRTKCLTS